MIKVYGAPQTRATRITWLLEELGEKFDYQLIDFSRGDSQAPAFLKVSPAGKVPAIQDEQGRTILESAAILNYLADRGAAGKLIPAAGSYERAQYDQWSYFALTELEQPLWTIGKHKFALPKAQRKPDVIETASWEFQKALTLLSSGLAEHDYILGACGLDWNRFMAVDILIAHTLLWGRAFKQPIEQENVQKYMQRMLARDAFQRVKAFESELIKS